MNYFLILSTSDLFDDNCLANLAGKIDSATPAEATADN